MSASVTVARRGGDRVADRAARRGSCGTGARRSRCAREPVVQRPVIAVSMSGEAWIAVRCMWWSTPRTPPSSSPPPARPGPPWTSIGSGEPWPVDSRGVVAVEHQDPAVPRRQAEHHGAGDVGVVGDERADQAALAAGGERDRLVERVVGRAPCCTGPNGSTSCGSTAPVGGAQQHGRDERAALGVAVDDVDVVGVAEDDLGRAAQRLDRLAHLLALVEARQRAHPDVVVGRVADGDLRQPRGDRLGDRRRRCAAGTITRRIAVHFWPALTVISVTTPLTNRSNSGSLGGDVGAEDRAVQRVGLDAELDAAVQHGGCCAQRAPAVCGRAGERDRVLDGRARRAGRPGCRRAAAASPRGGGRTR